MKFAVATDRDVVSGHFGHCQGFTIYEVEGQGALNKRFVENPGHRPGYLPVFLKEHGVDAIIAGGMGQRAQELFREQGIQVVVGATGSCDDNAMRYRSGELRSTGSVCTEHAHEGHCHE